MEVLLFIFIIGGLIKAAHDDAIIRGAHKRGGFPTYRGTDGKLHRTSDGGKLTADEIRRYYK